LAVGLAILAALALARFSQAAEITWDLTPGGGAAHTVNNAVFTSLSLHVSGTGTFNTFVRLEEKDGVFPPQSGYNTDGAKEFDTKDKGGSNWNHSIQVGDIEPIFYNGTKYRELILDINESQGWPDNLLSLDDVEIYLSDTPNMTGYGGWGAPAWELDTGGADNTILLDANLYAGSGKPDMLLWIPDSYLHLAGVPNPYVYVYSEFGGSTVSFEDDDGKLYNDWTPSDGFEEWAVIPEPGLSVLALGAFLVGAFARRWKGKDGEDVA